MKTILILIYGNYDWRLVPITIIFFILHKLNLISLFKNNKLYE